MLGTRGYLELKEIREGTQIMTVKVSTQSRVKAEILQAQTLNQFR